MTELRRRLELAMQSALTGGGPIANKALATQVCAKVAEAEILAERELADALRQWVEEHGKHTFECDEAASDSPMGSNGVCTCGLSKVLRHYQNVRMR